MKGSLGAKLGAALLAGPLKAMAGELSGAEYGGAILLGLRAPVVKGHGATSAEAVCAGTLSCAAYARANLCEKIAQACETSRANGQNQRANLTFHPGHAPHPRRNHGP